MECIACKGNGKQILTIHDGENPLEVSMEIDCIWCNGRGQMTQKEFEEYSYFNNAWCKCGNPSGDVSFYRNGSSHGYTCVDCGKIIQTG
jgi:hypothetical protein